jgi:hypothetical protein
MKLDCSGNNFIDKVHKKYSDRRHERLAARPFIIYSCLDIWSYLFLKHNQ